MKSSDCIFRIYKDTRFSKDKTPYKTHFGAYIADGGRKSNKPGYYIHLEPDGSFVAAGLYQPPPEILKAVRSEVYYHTAEFKDILAAKSFAGVYPGLMADDKLSRPPKDFPADFPDIDLLKYKHYMVSARLGPKQLSDSDFHNIVAAMFKKARPLTIFLNRALQMI
jgi:uncharacterized protein (TIGR02453 family)